MKEDKLLLWEKVPVVGLFLAQGLYVWRWYVGPGITPPTWVVILAGIAAVAAIDGAMVATVAGMRQGRRSRASYAAIVVTAAFGAAVALDLYGAITMVSAWLHAGFALTIVCYLIHLAASLPGGSPADLRRLLAQRDADLAQMRQELEDARRGLARTPDLLAQRDAELVGREVALRQAEAEAAQLREALRQAVAQRDAALARPALEDGAATVEIGGKSYSLRQAAEALDVPEATLRRKLGKVNT
jgi:Skp family chaperone for outer membrane proteins